MPSDESDMPPLTDDMHSKLRSLERNLCLELAACCSNYELLDPEAAFEYARTYAVKFFDCYYNFYSQYPKYSEYWRPASETHAFQRLAKCLNNSSSIRHYFEGKPNLVKRIKGTISEHSESKEVRLLPPSAYAAAGVDIDSATPLLKMAMTATRRPQVFASLENKVTKRRIPRSINSQSAAKKLEDYLSAKGLSQTEFAIKINVDQKTLYRFRSTGKVGKDVARTIADAMGVSLDEFIAR